MFDHDYYLKFVPSRFFKFIIIHKQTINDFSWLVDESEIMLERVKRQVSEEDIKGALCKVCYIKLGSIVLSIGHIWSLSIVSYALGNTKNKVQC